ncbi:hypothetical protein BPUN_2248 [Candidatus Paraburkholderia kirkii]|nr:hypothetical protein BPUN_2248 [Candidatus Paraburkholderia kirkii]
MWSTTCPISSSVSNSDYLREHARRLLRHARDSDTSAAMPVLRRLLAARVTRAARLADLHALRDDLRLKHLLAMLAAESATRAGTYARPPSMRARPRRSTATGSMPAHSTTSRRTGLRTSRTRSTGSVRTAATSCATACRRWRS